MITSSLTGLKNKPLSLTELKGTLFQKSLSSCKEIFFTLSQRFFGQACLPEFVESGHSGTCGNDFRDGGFNGTLDLKNIFKNSRIASPFAFHGFTVPSSSKTFERWSRIVSFETAQFFQVIDWFISRYYLVYIQCKLNAQI